MRPSKRARLMDEQSIVEKKFNDGSIVRIKLENFMTYKNLEIFLGPHLNMVLGPNGTGKSAVVCSIIVGLAGEVTLTGRASSVVDLVKNGQRNCKTEIELYNKDGDNFIVERRITITKKNEHSMEHKNEWKLNGRSVKKSDVKQFIDKLNIKVDNLCQFLPQDSVTHFVKMTSSELLCNTLLASGDTTLVDDHKKLVDATKTTKSIDIELNQVKTDLKAVEVNYERSRAEVKRLRERENLKNRQATIGQKIHYTRYLDKKAEYDNFKDREKKMEIKLEESKKKDEPMIKAITRANEDVTKFKELIQKFETEIKEKSALVESTQDSIKSIVASMTGKYKAFKSKNQEENERKKLIADSRKELDAMEKHLHTLLDHDCSRELFSMEKEIETKKNFLRELAQQVQKNSDEMRFCQNEMDRCKDELKKIESVADKKSELLRTRFPKVSKAAEWLSKNKNRFRSQIHMPMMCTIDVKDPQFTKQIEQSIPRNDLCAFVCENPSDLTLFTKAIREEIGVNVNVVLAPPKDPAEYVDDSYIRKLKSCGVHATLLELIEAPDPVLSYLCATHHFHNIPVAVKLSPTQLQSLRNLCRRFYVGPDLYVQSQSRIDGEKITTKDHVRDAQFLKFIIDKQLLQSCQKRLTEARSKYDKSKGSYDQKMIAQNNTREEWQKLSEKRSELKQKHDERKILQEKMKLKKDQIIKLEHREINLVAERKLFEESVSTFNEKYVCHLTTLEKNIDVYLDYRSRLLKNRLLRFMAEKNHIRVKKEYELSKQDYSRIELELRKLKIESKEKRIELESQKQETAKHLPTFTNGRLSPETISIFETLPDTIDLLENESTHLQAKIETIYMSNDSNLMSEYSRQKKEIQEKKEKEDKLRLELDNVKGIRDSIKDQWKPNVDKVVEVINNEYKSFMKKLHYDGRVELDIPEDDPDNFADYGIKIMVKYREEEKLIPLSATRQSGGERSVATMIYMLALQTITSVPFRCVDEINQGMDQDNERKVFELLVKTADASDSQYFLVSPKLLPDLPYSEKMKIHVVYSGPQWYIDWNKKFKT